MLQNAEIKDYERNELDDKSQAELAAIYDAILDTVPSRAPIFTPTEKIPLQDRILGMQHVRRIYRKDLDDTYRPRLQALRERFKGRKRCFLIGNGPSLNDTDLSLLKDEVTFAVNGFFLKCAELDWTPTFYCVEDHLVAEDRAKWIRDFHGPIKFFPAYLGYMFDAAADTIFYNHRPRVSYPDGFDFSHEADKITYTGCTVTFSLMQLATYLGFEEMYLIGVDASYEIPKDVEEGADYDVGVLDMKSDDPNHFDPNYFGKGFRWHDPQVHKMIEAYEEARRSLEGTGQTIYNATIGGKLEVFERRDYYSLFPHSKSVDRAAQPKSANALPRLLVIDMTATGNGSATGEIKSNLLVNWPTERFLQVSSPASGSLGLVRRSTDGHYSEQIEDPDSIQRAIVDFDPDVILYRPLADRPELHRFAMSEIAASQARLAIWMMDDWPKRLEAENPGRFRIMHRDLESLMKRADKHLSISAAMSEAFQDRYGVSFLHVANGIDPTDWTPPALRKSEGSTIIRYAGGLAADMNAASIARVAHAVETLATQGQDIRFEINTQPWWIEKSGHLFTGLTHTSVTSIQRSAADYKAWLQDADILLIAYNFDEPSVRYVRFSMANKLPECLAAGAALLLHGPRGVATIDRMLETDAAEVVCDPDVSALTSSLARLSDPVLRAEMGKKAHQHAIREYNLDMMRDRLETALTKFSDPVSPQLTNKSCDDQVLETSADIGFYTSPLTPVVRALSEETDIDTALEECCQIMGEILSKARLAPTPYPLIEKNTYLADVGAYAKPLEALGITPPVPFAAVKASTEEDIGYRALAALLLRQNPRANALLCELQARSLSPSNAPQIGELTTAELSDLSHKLHRIPQRIANQLASKDAEITVFQSRVESLENALAISDNSKRQLEQRLRQLQASSDDWDREIRQAQDGAANLNDEIKALKQQLDAAETQLKTSLNDIYKSTSWRVTRPIRKLKSYLTGAKLPEDLHGV